MADEIDLARVAPDRERLFVSFEHLVAVHPVATERSDRIEEHLIAAALGKIGLDPDRAIRVLIPFQQRKEIFLLHRQVDEL